MTFSRKLSANWTCLLRSKVRGPQGVNSGCEKTHRDGELGFPWKQEKDEPGQGGKRMGGHLISAQMGSHPLSLHHLCPRLFHSSLAGLPASTLVPYNLLQTQQPDWPWKPESHRVSPPQTIHWLISHSESRLRSSRGLGDHPRSGHLCLSAPRPAETFQLLITPEHQSPSPHLVSVDMYMPQDICAG